MLSQHPALMSPLVGTSREYVDVLRVALGEIEHRARLYNQIGSFPEKIDEYNRSAVGIVAPLRRVLVVLDEFNSAVSDTGGPSGELARLAALVAWRGRKFGVSLVFAAQDFSKEIIGRVRDQVGAVIAHRVRSEEVARNLGLAAAARISENRPGRALTDRWGLVQAYFIDKAELMSDSLDGLTVDERELAERARREYDGKISLDVLTGWGMGQRDARRLQDDWKLRGWAANDPTRANALYVTPKLMGLLDKLTNPTNLTNPAISTDKLTNRPDKLTNR
jgi:DNA segregation ATPase FtsK/SpoIIIE-like protein